jgi:hypothetical protein
VDPGGRRFAPSFTPTAAAAAVGGGLAQVPGSDAAVKQAEALAAAASATGHKVLLASQHVGKIALLCYQHYALAKQFKHANRALKTL